MKRRLVVFLKIALIVSAVALGAAAAGVVFLTGPLLQAALPAVSHHAPFSVHAQEVSGNLLSGLRIENLSVNAPQADVHVASASVRFELSKLLEKRAVLPSVVVHRPVVSLKAGDGPAKEKPPPEKTEPGGWAFAVQEFRFDDGVVLWGPAAGRRAVGDVRGRLAFVDETLTIENLAGRLAGSEVSAQGRLSLEPRSADLRLVSRGSVEGRAHAWWTPETSTFTAHAQWRDGFLRGRGGLEGKRWYGSLRFRNVDPRPLAALPEGLAPLSGNLEFEGRGFRPADLEGRAEARIRSEKFGAFTGRARAEDGAVRAEFSYLDNGMAMRADGVYSISGEVKAEGTLVTSRPGLEKWTGRGGVYATAHWSATGRWPELKWEIEGAFDDGRFREHTVGGGRFRAQGTGPKALFVDGLAVAENVKSGGREIDFARAAFSGDAKNHRFFVRVESRGLSLTAYGRGEREEGLWTVVAESLELDDGVLWRSTAPFSLAVGPGFFSVDGFAMTDGQAAASVDARLKNDRWEIFRVRIDRFDSRPWKQAGLWPFPANGVFEGRADLAGPVKKPHGTLRMNLTDFRWKEHPLGRIRASGRLEDALLRLEPLLWESPGGTLTVRGAVPLQFKKGKLPPFNLTIETIDFAFGFLNPLLPAVDLASTRLRSDLRVIHRAGEFQAQGGAKLTADSLRVMHGQVPLRDVRLSIEGQGPTLRIVEVFARSGDGVVSGHGPLRPRGPDVRLRADEFPIALEGLGFDARGNAELAIQGTWSAPLVKGWVELEEGNYRPPEKKEQKKDEPAAGAKKEAQAPSPLALDIALRYDRNVWYKQEDTAVETRADLRFQKDSRGPLRMLGSVESVRGQYVYYGRAFQIEEGRVTFLGHSPPNPRLDVKALYLAEESGTRVLLHAHGSIRDPRLDLSSEPPLSQQDVLAVLLFGAPLDQAGGGDGPGQEAAVEVLSGYLIKELRDTRLFRKLDIDVFRVRQTAAGGNELTVGRYLTEDLYVAYEQTVGEQGQRRLRAEYAFLPHWSILGRTAEDRYILDFLFKYDLP